MTDEELAARLHATMAKLAHHEREVAGQVVATVPALEEGSANESEMKRMRGYPFLSSDPHPALRGHGPESHHSL